MSAHKDIYIGMLGCGVVGSQVAALLEKNNAELSTRAGAKLILKKIAVRDIKAARAGISPSLFTTDAQSVINDSEIDIII
jgi:homoserine dehydrogenase